MDMPQEGSVYATQNKAVVASAAALRWLNASVRLPSVFFPSAAAAAPTGAISFWWSAALLGFLQRTMEAMAVRSASNAA